jgi:hypothetical protein
MGTRLIEDFLARTGLQRCSTFAETAEVISKVSQPLFASHSSTLVKYTIESQKNAAHEIGAIGMRRNI